MGFLRPFFLVVLLLVLSAPPAACTVCPTDGVYTTGNGSMEPGRASEAWCPPAVFPGRPGNTENAQSWDGAALGTEWKLWGMSIDAYGAVEIANTIDGNGNGSITYQTQYDGGQFWLSKDGLWGDGVNDLTGEMANYTVITTVTYSAGTMVGATSNITATGLFDSCRPGVSAISFVIANAMLIWHPAWPAAMPSGYPLFLCGAPTGELFGVCCITMQLGPVPVEEQSWGFLKSLYR